MPSESSSRDAVLAKFKKLGIVPEALVWSSGHWLLSVSEEELDKFFFDLTINENPTMTRVHTDLLRCFFPSEQVAAWETLGKTHGFFIMPRKGGKDIKVLWSPRYQAWFTERVVDHDEVALATPAPIINLKELFVVRLYDMFDGWMDITNPVSKEDAERVWNEKTVNGTEKTQYSDGDYYKVFPANTRMIQTPEFRGR